MSHSLIIVESPTKSKTIGTILGSSYSVKSTMGHIRDLPAYKFGVDVEHDFALQYEVMREKKALVKELVAAMKKAKDVYIATDEDREGEAIGWHVVELSGIDPKKFKRITFHEITPQAIKDSFNHARSIDANLVNAQQARRVLDRIVGYKLSPLLGRKIYKGLSAGRVQSVTVRMIVEREREIEKFIKEEYWTIKAECAKQTKEAQSFSASFVSKAGTQYKKLDIKNKEMVDTLIQGLDGIPFCVTNVEKKERKRNPWPPFITSTLQQTASRMLGFSSKKTMFIAQELYEGVTIGKETIGLITYMRTDSPTIAAPAQQATRAYIVDTFGDAYLPATPRVFKAKSKNAQEAHECIRPTDVTLDPERIKHYLSPDQLKLYRLIWQRFCACQMKEALFEQVVAELTAKDTVWHATGQTLLFDGFLKIYRDDSDEENDETMMLPPLTQGEHVDVRAILPEQHFTDPPPRYNEASLIKALEQFGIGRPSTYAPTISTIVQRGYVRLESKRFFPEPIGVQVTELLEKHFPKIVDINFTATMEESLDTIADGEQEWKEIIKAFYVPFAETIKNADSSIVSQKTAVITDEKCPKCGAALLIRKSRYGEFLACSAFPGCRYTKSMDEKKESDAQGGTSEQPAEEQWEPCPTCGGKLVTKRGRFGTFIACSTYPACKYARPLKQVAVDKQCPECGKPLVVKFSKRGRFLGCSGYPSCKHIERMAKPS